MAGDEVLDLAASDLAKLKSWFDHNTLAVSEDKTKCLPIHFKNNSGTGQRSVRDQRTVGDLRQRCDRTCDSSVWE